MDFSAKYNKRGNEELSKRLNDLIVSKNKTLPKKERLTNEKLAELIERNGGKCSVALVSYMRNAKRPISKQNARALACIFEIDASYLLDESVTYKTAAEKFNSEFQAAINELNQEAYYMNSAICSLALLNGYTVKLKTKKDIARALGKAKAFGGEGKIADALKDFMVFFRNGKEEFTLNPEDAKHLGNFLSDLFLSHIKWNIGSRPAS